MIWVRYCFCLAFFITSHCCYAQNSSLTEDISYPYLEKLVRTAKENYPRVKVYKKHIDIANKNALRAKLSWFEALGFYILYNPNNTTENINPNFVSKTFKGAQIGMTVNIGTIFQKPTQLRIARDEVDIAKLDSSEYNLTIEALVKDRYFKYIEQLAIVRARSRSVLDMGVLLTSVRGKFEKGEETFENYSRAMVLYNDQNQLKITAEASMMSARAFLEEILNRKLDDIK